MNWMNDLDHHFGLSNQSMEVQKVMNQNLIVMYVYGNDMNGNLVMMGLIMIVMG